MPQTLRLGTRGSLLARAQSRQVAGALRALHPRLNVDLVPVSTRGDRDQSVALRNVQDPDFFSAELDAALLGGEVDFCVHSLKDLPVTRPSGIARAALPVRENPRDVIVWRADVRSRLGTGQALRIGASSPRRQRNVADFLPGALPATARAPAFEFHDLRGPVDERLARLSRRGHAEDALDGVVLALAGLARLWNDADARPKLSQLLADVNWTVLPLAKCPGAAGQGILAIECRAADGATLEMLRALHDPDTAELAALEQSALEHWPAETRAGLGATAIMHDTLGPVCYVRGGPPGKGDAIERVLWNVPPRPERAVGFDGIAWQRACTRAPATSPLADLAALAPRAAVFVAYWHALEHQALRADARVWVSGVESWRRLAARGHWVEGCGDHLGFEDIRATLECPALGLPPLRDWTALTYGWAVPGWRASGIGRVLATYEIRPPVEGEDLRRLQADASRATHFYWSSAEQFHALRAVLPGRAHHACGAGKTLQALRAAGVDAEPFPNGREWQRWLH